MERGAPVFVKVDNYKEILDVLDLVKNKVAEVKRTMDDINSLKAQEDAELQGWSNSIADLQAKIDSIDNMMYEPEQ